MQHLVELYGKDVAARINRRMSDIEAAPNLQALAPPFPGLFRAHEGSRSIMAFDVGSAHRVLFSPIQNMQIEGTKKQLDWSQVKSIQILKVEH